MKATGDLAVRLAERYGLPIQKEADDKEGYREDIPLEDAQWILRHDNPTKIYVEVEPELIDSIREMDAVTPRYSNA